MSDHLDAMRNRIASTNGKQESQYPRSQVGDAFEGTIGADDAPDETRQSLQCRCGSGFTIGVCPDCDDPDTPTLPIFTAGELVAHHPNLREPILEGLLRRGETMNVIAASKVGKSWLTYSLAFAIATGRPWLDTFEAEAGEVLLIDNELHPETLAHRLPKVAASMGVPWDHVKDRISIIALRGRLLDLDQLAKGLRALGRDRFKLVTLDAFYRALPKNTDENANGTMAGLYNLIDAMADRMGAAFTIVHHASKGDQSAKSITDVGSGAGAQSRATDTHLVLRPHEDEGVYVLEAAVRSFAPVAPLCVRWEYPTWRPEPSLDPKKLRKTGGRPRGDGEDKPAEWTPERFASEFGKPEARTRTLIVEQAVKQGLSNNRAINLLKSALEGGLLFSWKEGGANTPTWISINPRPDENGSVCV